MSGQAGQDGAIGVREWLAAREPAPPPQLAKALSDAVGDSRCETLNHLPNTLLGRAESLLALLGDGRESAESLLAADALITYALEAAADDCESVDSVALVAMQAMGSLTKKGSVRG